MPFMLKTKLALWKTYLKQAFSVLFFRTKAILTRPSHSWKALKWEITRGTHTKVNQETPIFYFFNLEHH